MAVKDVKFPPFSCLTCLTFRVNVRHMGPYSPFTVSRFFIERASQNPAGLSPMKLIKLVYISHGWNLAFYDEGLIYEPVQAWQYGPVIESLYHAFKQYGNASISADEVRSIEALPTDPADNGAGLLEKVWQKYSGLSAVHLSALTHQPGTPWYTVWNEKGGKDIKRAIIPNDLIKDFYKRKLQKEPGSGH